MGGPGGWVPIWVTMEQGFQVRSGSSWPGWARRDWMGWSWMGWLLHRLKLALKCCGFLADIPSSDSGCRRRSSSSCGQCHWQCELAGPAGWARPDWTRMGWSWTRMGWLLLHRLKLALKCCGFLADIPSSDCRSSCQCQCELTASVTGPGPGPGPGARVGPGPAYMIAA